MTPQTAAAPISQEHALAVLEAHTAFEPHWPAFELATQDNPAREIPRADLCARVGMSWEAIIEKIETEGSLF